jgi:hypothetical protein
MVRNKYGVSHGIWRVKMKANDSPFWKSTLIIKEIYLRGRKISIGDGKATDFFA